MIAWSSPASATGAILSITTTIILSPILNVGAAVIGYLIYIIVQMTFYYIYYIPNVLELNSKRLFFKSFLPSTLIGIITAVFTEFIYKMVEHENIYFGLAIKSVLFTILWLIMIWWVIFQKEDKNRIRMIKQILMR